MVNCGEEKVRVHMNVVPRSTGNTSSSSPQPPPPPFIRLLRRLANGETFYLCQQQCPGVRNLRSGVPYIFCRGGKVRVPSRSDKKYKGRLIAGYVSAAMCPRLPGPFFIHILNGCEGCLPFCQNKPVGTTVE